MYRNRLPIILSRVSCIWSKVSAMRTLCPPEYPLT